MLDAPVLGSEHITPVEPVHRAVKRLMHPSEVRRQQVGVAEIGLCRIWVFGMGIQHRRYQMRRVGQVHVPRWHRERAVDKPDGETVAAFKRSANVPQPSHVHCGRQKREVRQ